MTHFSRGVSTAKGELGGRGGWTARGDRYKRREWGFLSVVGEMDRANLHPRTGRIACLLTPTTRATFPSVIHFRDRQTVKAHTAWLAIRSLFKAGKKCPLFFFGLLSSLSIAIDGAETAGVFRCLTSILQAFSWATGVGCPLFCGARARIARVAPLVDMRRYPFSLPFLPAVVFVCYF